MANDKEILINHFGKGINQAVDSTLIQTYEACDAQNFEISEGTIRKKKDDKLYDSSQNALIGMRRVIRQNMMALSNDNIIKLFATAHNGSTAAMYKMNTNSHGWDKVLDFSNFAGAAYVDHICYQINGMDVMIFTNGTDPVKLYDGSTFRNLKYYGKTGTVPSGDDNTAPLGKFIELFKNRVFISGDEGFTNSIYFSTKLDPDDWTVPGTEEANNTKGGVINIPTWDSGLIIGMRALYDDLLIFKNTAVFKLSGDTPEDFVMQKIFDSSEGYIVDQSIRSLDNMAFWATSQGIYSYDGVEVRCISDPVKGFYNTINYAYIKNAVAEMYDNKYILAVSTGASAVNNKVIEYNIPTKAFMIYDPTAIDITSFMRIVADKVRQEKLLYSTGASGKIYEWKAGTGYTSAASWLTGGISMNSLNTTKNCSYLYFLGKGTGTVRFSIISERGTKYKDITLNQDTMKSFKVKIKGKGKTLAIKIDCPSTAFLEVSKVQIPLEIDFD